MLLLLASALAGVPVLVSGTSSTGPAIDGVLDDPVWALARTATVFVEKTPREGAAPLERTELLVLHDRGAIYVGLRCFQEGGVIGRRTRRDRVVEGDRVTVDVDADSTHRSAFHFEVNAAGVQADAIRLEERPLAFEWDEVWKSGVKTTTAGWTAEIEIPFRALRFALSEPLVFGLQVRRYVSARGAIAEWAHVPRSAGGEILHYGHLELRGEVAAGGGFELRPFVLGQLTRKDAAEDPFSPRFSAGLDVRWHALEDLTVDAAINPDFGQVEADQVVLNLTNFETFFPEKRPFFLEGLAIFENPMDLLYTRRIGRQPAPPDLPEGATALEDPQASPIYGALKISGHPRPNLGVGALAAITGPVDVAYTQRGERGRINVEPLSVFGALRLTGNVADRTQIGALATGVIRLEPRDRTLCPDGITPSGGRCTHDAYVGAIDFTWRSPSGDYVSKAQLAGSAILNGPARELSDGTRIEPGTTAPGGGLQLIKAGGTWLFEATYLGFAPAFDPNDLGFLERQNVHRVFLAAAYRDTEAGDWFLDHRLQLELYGRWNSDGLPLGGGIQVNHRGTLTSLWAYFFEVHYRPRYFDDREIGDGRALERDRAIGLVGEVYTDKRLPVSFDGGSYVKLAWNGVQVEGWGSIDLRVLPELDLAIQPNLIVARGEPRFAGSAADGTPVFGRLYATGAGTTLRATYTLTAELSIQAYAQVFASSQEYRDRLVGPAGARRFELDALVPGGALADDPSSVEGALNLTAILRWEYLPGSTAYLVYSRAQSDSALPDPARGPGIDLGAIGRGEAVDVLLLKVSLWMGV